MTDKLSQHGLAARSPAYRRKISRLGGHAVPREKRAFARDRELARVAGQKGGFRRREANAKDAELLKLALIEPLTIPHDASGRMKARIQRLLKLDYIIAAPAISQRSDRYRITEAGRGFLAGL